MIIIYKIVIFKMFKVAFFLNIFLSLKVPSNIATNPVNPNKAYYNVKKVFLHSLLHIK